MSERARGTMQTNMQLVMTDVNAVSEFHVFRDQQCSDANVLTLTYDRY